MNTCIDSCIGVQTSNASLFSCPGGVDEFGAACPWCPCCYKLTNSGNQTELCTSTNPILASSSFTAYATTKTSFEVFNPIAILMMMACLFAIIIWLNK